MPATRRVQLIAITALVVAACGGPAVSPEALGTAAAPTATERPTPSIVATPSASATSSAASLPDAVDIEEAGALAIDATRDTDWIVLVDGNAWVAGMGDGIGILDPMGSMTRSVEVRGWCAAMDTGFEAVWSASCDPPGVIRIEPATGVAARATFEEPIVDSEASVGAGEGAVWVVVDTGSNLLIGIDPATLEVLHRFALPGGAAGVRAGLGGVWVTRPNSDELLRVDPATGDVVATIEVGETPRFLAIGEGSVWVMNQSDGSISRIDPATNTVTATIPVGLPIHGGDIAVGGGAVWVRGGPELLARIDPATNEVSHRWGPLAGSGGVAADEDAVWVTAHDIERIWRLPLD
jgi:YVTN family beta-propeller protein